MAPRAWVLASCLLLAPLGYFGLRIVPPTDFHVGDQADPTTLIQVDAWSAKSSTRATLIATSVEHDSSGRPGAILAVLERDVKLPRAATADEGAATAHLAELVKAIEPKLDTPDFVEVMVVAGEKVIHAAYSSGDRDFEFLLAPSGETSALVVLTADPSQRDKWEHVFDDLVASASGIDSSRGPLHQERVRWLGFTGVLLSAFGLHAFFLARGDRRGDHRSASVRAAVVLTLFTAAAATLLYVLLVRDPKLAASVASPSRMALELVAAAMVASILLVAIARFFVPDQKIQSAPPGSTEAPPALPGIPRAVNNDAPLEDLYRSRD